MRLILGFFVAFFVFPFIAGFFLYGLTLAFVFSLVGCMIGLFFKLLKWMIVFPVKFALGILAFTFMVFIGSLFLLILGSFLF